YGIGPGEFEFPAYFNIDHNDNIYVYDDYLFRLSIFSAEGEFLDSFSFKGSAFTRFSISNDGEIVTNSFSGSDYFITVLDKKGNILKQFDKTPDYFELLPALGDAFHAGNIFKADNGNYYLFLKMLLTIRVFNEDGILISEYDFDKITEDKKACKKYISPDEYFLKPDNTREIFVPQTASEITYFKNEIYFLQGKTEFPNNECLVIITDMDLNVKRKYNLSIMQNRDTRSVYSLGFEVLNNDPEFLVSIPAIAEVFKYKPVN
ncbi:hypothetical protein ACFL7D_07410, partial [candidate division KSB1 bacterium]